MIPAAKLCLIAMASLLAFLMASGCLSQDRSDQRSPDSAIADLLAGRFRWSASQPLVRPITSADDTYHSVKDPSVVLHEGKWHLFCTIRGQNRSHQVEYLSFADWGTADTGQRQMLTVSDGLL